MVLCETKYCKATNIVGFENLTHSVRAILNFFIAFMFFACGGCEAKHTEASDTTKVQPSEFTNKLLDSGDSITQFIFVEDNNCKALSYLNQWIDSMPGKHFLVVLKICDTCDCPSMTQSDFNTLNRKISDGTVIITKNQFNAPAAISLARLKNTRRKSGNVNLLRRSELSQFAIPEQTTDYGADGFTPAESDNGREKVKTIYVYEAKYKSDSLSRILKQQFNANSVVYLPGKTFLQAGNYFTIDGHIFIGTNFLFQNIRDTNRREVDSILRKAYNLPFDTSLTIDFIGRNDTNYSRFYHLDLVFTTIGPDSTGLYKIFISNVLPEDTINTPGAKDAFEYLNLIRDQFDRIMSGYRSVKYEVIPVPIFLSRGANGYVVTSVNGISEMVNKTSKYYFPLVDTVRAGPQSQKLYDRQRQALQIFRNNLGSGNVIVFNFPLAIVKNNSQSLHCTLGIIGRGN